MLALLCISSLFAAPLIGIEDEKVVVSEELAALDVISYTQKPLISQEMQLPTPAFEARSYKSSYLAVGLSSLIPGLGHVYLGDMKTAGGLIGTTGLGLGTGFGIHSSSQSNEFIRSTSFLAVETAWFYGLYAAYRDVRKYNGQFGYSYQMPTDSFADLTTAPFNFSVLKKPEVWGGLLGSLAIAFGAVYFAFHEEAHIRPFLSLQKTLLPITALPIGIGEESLFRGFLQSQFSEWLTPWGGIVLSSLLFGAAHIPNAWDLERHEQRGYYSVIVPLITLSGIYDGWLTYKNHSLKESVAIHTWYDFILFTISSLASQTIVKGRAEFAMAIPF